MDASLVADPPASQEHPGAVPEDDDALAEEIASLAARIAVATCRFLVLLGEMDARGSWAQHGILSCAHWLSWRCGMGSSTAREHVRVARALRTLPRTVEAFAAGRISYSKVRAITRVGTPLNEADLVEIALCAPANHLERLVRGLRTAQAAERPDLRHARRHLSWRWAEDGSMLLSGRFPPEDAALIVEAIEQRRARARQEMVNAAPAPDPGPAPYPRDPSGADACVIVDAAVENGWSLADALVELCAEEPAAPDVARSSRVMETAVHVTLADLRTKARGGRDEPVPAVSAADLAEAADPGGAAIAPQRLAATSLRTTPRLEGGHGIAVETARRLACDGGIVVHVHDDDVAVTGRTLEVGARTRKPGAALVRALWARDQGCRYPGCDRRRFINAHHVTHWADGGPTVLANMVLLCGAHHRLLHEDRYALTLEPDGTLRVQDAAGRPVAPVPPQVLLAGRELLDAGADPWSLTPDWGGEALDEGYATSVLLALWERPAGRAAA